MAGATEVSNIVVCGRQSSNIALLVNGLLGIQLVSAEETRRRCSVIKEQTEQAPGPNQPDVQLKVCIFSGFGTDDSQTTDLIRQCCSRDKVGVLLYCITAEGLGIKTAEIREEINKITSAYGVDIWKTSVIVFLKAHRCARALQRSTGSGGESFNRAIELWKEQVRSIMLSGSMITPIPPRTVRKLAFVVAGKENELALPGRDFWLSVVWVQVFERSTRTCYKKGISQLAKFQARTKERDEMRKPEVSDDIKGKKIWEQPISTGEMSLRQKIAIGAGGTAAGIAAGGVGASIGAVIGALAIGIPTFGVAAGAGLVIGAAVGGGIGVGVAGATTAGVKAYQNVKEKEEQEECKYNYLA